MTIKDDLDTIFVAIDRLNVLSLSLHDGERYFGMHADMKLSCEAQAALARIHERLANSVPVEQEEMEMGE